MTETTERLLPTERQTPQAGMLYRRILLYGDPGVGKTTTAAEMADNPLIFDSEGSAASVSAYVARIHSWEDFRKTAGELAEMVAEPDCPFDLVSVDTVDAFSNFCSEYVMEGLGAGRRGFVHPSDFEYGKGWAAVEREFQLRIAKLAALGLPVVFISHAETKQVKSRTGEISVKVPDLAPKGIRKWLEGFVDAIFYAEVRSTEEGQQRLLRTAPSETWQAKARTPRGTAPLEDPLPLDGKTLRQELTAAAPA